MKKLLVVLLALTALSVAAFADDVTWTFGTTVKTGAVITASSDADPTIGVNDADDTVLSRVRFDAEAALGDFAAHVRVGGDGAGVLSSTYNSATQPPAGTTTVTSTGTFIPAWWVNAYLMNKMIQLQFGNLDHSVTDTVNKGWGGVNVEGAQVIVTPIEGLNIGLAVPVAPVGKNRGTLGEALAFSKIGFAYTMPNLVTLKATYMGAGIVDYDTGAGHQFASEDTATLSPSVSQKNNEDFAFGVAVLAVPNLTAQFEVLATNIGMKDSIGEADSTTKPVGVITSTTELFQDIEYAIGPLTPGIELDELLYGDNDIFTQKPKTTISIKPKVNYTIMTGTDAGLSVQYVMDNFAGAAASQTAGKWATANKLVVDPYVKFTFNDKAKVKIDAAYTIADMSDSGTWTLPININFMYGF